MQPLHFRIILFSFVLYFLCSGITLRDLVLVHFFHTVQNEALVRVSAKDMFEGALSGMMMSFDKLHDDYSHYIPYRRQKDFFGELENNYDGIGIIYSTDINKKELPVIMYPLLNSPAYEAGIRSGDKIVKVNSRNTAGLSARELSQLFEKAKFDRTKGKNISITIQKFQSKETVELTPAYKPLFRDTVEGDGIDNTNTEGRRTFTLQTKPDIGYIRITSFSSLTAEELKTALQKIDKPEIKGLILDLRGNPGGFVMSSVETANLFIKPSSMYDDVIVSTRSRSETVQSSYKINSGGYKFGKPLVVLIDGDTASSAEILAAALQDYKRAKIVGKRSFGKGTVQEILELPFNSGVIKLTHCGYWRPSGKNINRFWNSKDTDEWGVSPDENCEVKVSEEQSAAQTLLRNVRSNASGEKKDEYLTEYIKQLPKEVKQFIKEQEEENGSETSQATEKNNQGKAAQERNLILQGNAPYYDPQLEKAVNIINDCNHQ